MRITSASVASTSRTKLLTSLGKVEKPLTAIFIKHNCADWNLQDHVRTGSAVAVGAFAVTSAVSTELAIVPVSQQGVFMFRRMKNHVAAIATVPTRWPAARDVFLPSKGDAAIPAVAAFYENFCFVNKHVSPRLKGENTTPLGGNTKEPLTSRNQGRETALSGRRRFRNSA